MGETGDYRRVSRAMLVTLGVLLCWPAVSVQAAGEASLVRDVVVAAERAAYVDVLVPTTLHPTVESSRPKVTYVGEGLVVHVVMRRLDGADAASMQQLEFLRIGPPEHRGQETRSSLAAPDEVLMPGVYRLYVQSEQPAQVHLHFPELAPGTLALQARRPVAFQAMRLRELAARDPNTLVVGGDGSIARDGGDVAMLTWLSWPTPGTYEFCFYPGGADNHADAFQRGCGSSPEGSQATHLEGSEELHLAHYSNLRASSYGVGFNATAATSAPQGGAVAYWASYDDDAPRDADRTNPPLAVEQLVLARRTLVVDRSRRHAIARFRCSGQERCVGDAHFQSGPLARIVVRPGKVARVAIKLSANDRRRTLRPGVTIRRTLVWRYRDKKVRARVRLVF